MSTVRDGRPILGSVARAGRRARWTWASAPGVVGNENAKLILGSQKGTDPQHRPECVAQPAEAAHHNPTLRKMRVFLLVKCNACWLTFEIEGHVHSFTPQPVQLTMPKVQPPSLLYTFLSKPVHQIFFIAIPKESLGRDIAESCLVDINFLAVICLRPRSAMSFLFSTIGSGGYSLVPSTPSCNSSLAWAMGQRGEGRFLIKFPLEPGWYSEQPCTTFTSLEHRKECTGLRHEYIVLNLENGAICRLERMGDADARFNAILPQGSTAYDFAQCFQPEHISQAHPHPSDVIAHVVFPYTLDLKDVLAVCRAIQEGDKTCKYYNTKKAGVGTA
ncbi:hypothetical protein BDV93DRAFT_547286 [Ceratobasidium sp. AG-I]|nr:hypothetical protein BDV93DRAFT_547286 [Ceratobasidium sp. AG-I]